jgi:hypothetical protein
VDKDIGKETNKNAPGLILVELELNFSYQLVNFTEIAVSSTWPGKCWAQRQVFHGSGSLIHN